MEIRKTIKVLMGYILAFTFVFASAFAAEEKKDGSLSPGEKEYREKSVKLTALEIKVATAEANFLSLVKKKNALKNKKDILEIIQQMTEIQKQRDIDVVEFNKIRQELKYKYPDKGRTINRRYAPMREKTVEELEKPSHLAEELDKAKGLVEHRYAPFIKRAQVEKQKQAIRETKKESKESKPATERIRLER